MGRISSWKFVGLVLVFCAAIAITSPAQVFTKLADFDGDDGASPLNLIQATDGNFYGVVTYGAILSQNCAQGSCGTVFKMTPAGTVVSLYFFCPGSSCPDGANPSGGLVQGSDGNFYGTTTYGGNSSACYLGCGTVFKITPSGTLTTLHSFHFTDGAHPYGSLIQGTDGNFYGTTENGGTISNCGSPPQPCGTVFKITAAGTLTTLHSFNGSDGSSPLTGLVLASDGNFYGTTSDQGTLGDGTVFKIAPDGTLTNLHTFYGGDGQDPSALVQGTDGSFYGTTLEGGTNGFGTVFKVTSAGVLTSLYSFCAPLACPNGYLPSAALVQGTDGNFYGSTEDGGALGQKSGGTIFKITPAGTLTTLYSFCSQQNCTDGAYPASVLLQATDGNFYGTTLSGGVWDNCVDGGCGTTFRLSVGQSSSPVQFVPLTPCRLVDTRTQYGGSGPIQGGTFQTFNVPQLSQQKSCGDLSSATAYSLNPAVVPQGPLGYLTLWPAGHPLPLVSTMNSLDGRVKANAAIVQAGASQAISVFASNTTDVVLDIDGYFTPANQSTLAFYTLPPCRVADTRDPSQPPGLGPPFMPGGQTRDFPILTSNCQIPDNAVAYSFNMTAVPHVPLGYMTVWPAGQQQPVVSTLNAPTGTTTANAALVPAGTGGDIDVYPSNDTDLVIDINGYFAAPGAAGGQSPLSLYPVVPCRVLDTRNGNGAFVGELTVDVVDSACATPSAAQAYVFGATVVPSGPLGYLTLWPDGTPQPLVATLNAVDGAVTSNMAIVPTNNGSIDAYASNLTQLIIDISSYFAP